jgi:signal transduction histidine kinase
MQIKTRFIGSALLVMGLTVLLSGGRAVLMQQSEDALSRERQLSEQATSTVLDLNLAIRDELLIAQQSLLLNLQTDHLGRYHKASERFRQELTTLQEILPQEDRVAHLQLQALKDRHQALAQLIVPLLSDSPDEVQGQQMLRTLNTHEQDINTYLWDLLDCSKEWSQRLNHQFAELQRWSQRIEIVILSLIVGLFAVQAYSILLPALRNLARLQTGAELLGQGQLKHRLQITTKDEMAALAATFNHMADQLDRAYQGLEHKVAERTTELAQANQALEQEICDRIEAEANLKSVVQQLQRTQIQLIQTEKMSSLGQLVAGIAHEINNPVSFIAGNLTPTEEYAKDLLTVIQRYQRDYPTPSPALQSLLNQVDLPFLQQDFPKILRSMQNGVDRISQIVQSLKTFSRLDESEVKTVDVHAGLDSTLMLLESRLKGSGHRPAITIVKQYGQLPMLQCYAGQLNQVFMQILVNAVDAIEEAFPPGNADPPPSGTAPMSHPTPQIVIRTEATPRTIMITIADNGPGMPESIQAQIFDPFFTTKQVGKGTGLGLSMSHQIVVGLHQGSLRCFSQPGQGTRFKIQVPLEIEGLIPDRSALMTAG